MKKILGLDLGTNSIGWALVEQDFTDKEGQIIKLGSRIIPMSQDVMGKFDSGVSVSQTATRTAYRGVRRLYQRDNLRRDRLHRVLNILDFLPKHYAAEIDFEIHLGQFKEGSEPKINYKKNSEGKHEFMFMESFQEMAEEFKQAGNSDKIPYDWTLYYLRKKALRHKISKEELAWVILNFNQKRGYYQLRGEEEETDTDKQKEFCVLKVSEVLDSGEAVRGNKLYDIFFENGWKYDKQTTKPEDWINKIREFIVTTSTTSKGETKRSFKAVDSEKDWVAIKAKTEQNVEGSEGTVGEYIYKALLSNPTQKIRGELIRTIERKFYRQEFEKILMVQCSHHDELKSKQIYFKCVEELYPKNYAHQSNIKDKGFVHLFLNDIVFYQRPLKSKKSSISVCAYETRTFKKLIKEKTNNGIVEVERKVKEGIKAIPKSHPLFQEFRLWQFISNLRIYKQELKDDVDVSKLMFPDEDSWVDLFESLNKRKELEQKNIIEYLVKSNRIEKNDKEAYRWNYVEDKKYPCNETRAQFISRLKKVEGIDPNEFLTREIETHLWHIVYSVKDKLEFEKALKSFALKYKLDESSFFESFRKFPPFSNDYGAYSQKALSKLLPAMRMGKYWSESYFSDEIIIRIQNLINGEIDEKISVRAREKAINLNSITDFRGLPVWLACYVIYNRHSELGDILHWKSPQDIETYLHEFKQHSLRNPIVEQVVTETLRTVKDIWSYHGKGAENYFSEIHVELGREMKNPADARKQMSRRNTENENTNQRIRELLVELMNDTGVEGDIRPYSPSHQEILKIYEEGIYQNPNAEFIKLSADDVDKIRRNNSPSITDIKRYKLWLEQGYRSPYTGGVIPLSKLFTSEYQIEHIIPQARYFDDSLSNKVICESEVNALKSSSTAYEFIKNEKGRIVKLSGDRSVKLFEIEAYQDHCNKYFKKNRTKLTKLMSEDIPEGFINRQMNDTRYISKLIKSLLSNIVREEGEQEHTSKNLLPVTGAITSKLKHDWGLNDKWNEIVSPRFKRLNELTGSNDFGIWDDKINSFRILVPDELKRGFSKKRIDHRHHAMDALVIACASRKHIHYLNALNSEKENYSLRDSLLIKNEEGKHAKIFLMPWQKFPVEAKKHLQETIISFKQNLRIINKTNNKTWQWREQHNGELKKELVQQTKGDNWAIRKPLHKETVSGRVKIRVKKEVAFVNGVKNWQSLVDKNLRTIVKDFYKEGKSEKEILKHFKENPYTINEELIKKVELHTFTNNATATRKSLTDLTTRKIMESVTDSGIKRILENHLKAYVEDGKERFDLAFSPEGVEALNHHLKELNNGKDHQPIYKVRIYEEGLKFNVGNTGCNSTKMVEAAKGTNLFFAIYWNEALQKREYETIAFNVVVEHQKQVAHLPKELRTSVPINAEKGELLFVLSPNDLVYVPTEEELENPSLIDFSMLTPEITNRIYCVNDFSGVTCYFTPNHMAKAIVSKEIDSSFDSKTARYNGLVIKDVCWKISVDRIGIPTKIANSFIETLQVSP